jgi:putative hydrolase of the HAD superfamily
MKLRAVIFDLYGTLLDFGPPPPDAETRWGQVWQAAFGNAPRLTLLQFADECRGVVALEHTAARARGIGFPEVYWPDVVDAVLPEIAILPAAARADLPFYDADLAHTVHLMPGAADALRTAQAASLRLGLASNCQPYSLRELDRALATAGLSRDIFEPRLCFLSFEHGFSKPDPHVFRLLTARLRLLGLAPAETLMVGDRVDNDLEPARAHDWQTFAIGPDPAPCFSRLRGLLLKENCVRGGLDTDQPGSS